MCRRMYHLVIKGAIAMAIICNPQAGFAQAPHFFNYQGVARDLSGTPITTQSVSFRISVLQGTMSGSSLYQETHLTETSDLGLFNLHIGSGTIVQGDFRSIDWSLGPFFVKVELDDTGGENYKTVGTVQLLSVPYALHAANGSKWRDSERGLAYNSHVLIGAENTNSTDPGGQVDPQLSLSAPALSQVPGSINNERFIDCTIEDAPQDFFRIQNGTNSNGQFIPFVQGHHESHTWHALQLTASTSPAKDQEELAPLMIFDSRLRTGFSSSENTPVVNRNLFSWTSFGQTKMLMSASGNLGLGTIAPKAKVHVKDGDIYLEDMDSGIILKDANGGCWRVTVDVDGSLKSDSLMACP